MVRRPIKRGSCPPVSLQYLDAQHDESVRTVAPVALIGPRAGQATYLHARCSVAKAVRTFRFDRIETISDPATGEVFDLTAWVQSLQLGEAKPFAWTDDAGPQFGEAEPGGIPEPAVDRWRTARIAGVALTAGYLIGRLRLIHLLLHTFHRHWGASL